MNEILQIIGISVVSSLVVSGIILFKFNSDMKKIEKEEKEKIKKWL